MPVLEYEADFPLPAARLSLSLRLREEPVTLREYAMVIDVREPDGTPIPKGSLNWGYSAPLGGCYQYVPEARAGELAVFDLPILTDRPIGALSVTVRGWRPLTPGTDPHDIFDLLMISYSGARPGAVRNHVRFSTVRRSVHV